MRAYTGWVGATFHLMGSSGVSTASTSSRRAKRSLGMVEVVLPYTWPTVPGRRGRGTVAWARLVTRLETTVCEPAPLRLALAASVLVGQAQKPGLKSTAHEWDTTGGFGMVGRVGVLPVLEMFGAIGATFPSGCRRGG
jgi:hypothetical protein